MINNQNRKILEAAAKAYGIKGYFVTNQSGIKHAIGEPGKFKPAYFNPITKSADTASMCAKLDINTIWHFDKIVECADQWRSIYHAVPHDGTDEDKEAAWRLASSIVAAKIGGYTDDI